VEDWETLRILKDLGCDDAQGFFISEGLDGVNLVDWLMNFSLPAEDAQAPAEAAADCRVVPIRRAAAAG
jgi:EAL domain-containing protein (putative c-di-GMP-specific phosphodiesterase class I)